MAFLNGMIGSLSCKWDIASSHHLKPTSVRPFVPRKFVVQNHTHSDYSYLTTTMSSDLYSKFMQVYDSIKSDLLRDPLFKFDDHSRQWVDRMIDYNVPGGKMIRSLSLVDSYKLLNGKSELTDDQVFLSCTLGWCIEWLQGYLCICDDMMDKAEKRRGHPCWFRIPEVGMVAVNDSALLRSHIFRILKKYFYGKTYYVQLLDLFNEADFQTLSGQMIDMITTLGEKDLSKYSLSRLRQIFEYKSSYYSIYLPFACAFLLMGENLEDHVQVKDILVEMGIYYQIQDDYLDVFGDPKVMGKIGTDIQDFKCSWLIVKALELANEEQKKTLYENYGIDDPLKIAKVKEIYYTLNLQDVFEEYEKKTHEELIKSIEAQPSISVQAVLKCFLGRIYKRPK